MTPFVVVKSFLDVGKEKKRKELKETQLQGTLMNICLVLNSKCFSLILVRTKILIKQNIIGSINKNRSHTKQLLPEFFFHFRQWKSGSKWEIFPPRVFERYLRMSLIPF